MGIEHMWPSLLAGSIAALLATWIFAFTIRSRAARSWLSYLLPLLTIAACFAFGPWLNPFSRLFLSGAVLLFIFKGAALLRYPVERVRTMNSFGLLVYSSVWPGIDPTQFHDKPIPALEDGRRFGQGVARLVAGALLFLLIVAFLPSLSPAVAGWGAIFAILLAIHIGVSDAMTEFFRAVGWRVPVLFDAPWHSRSLSNFWSQRWNRPFVEMNNIFFLPWLTRRFGVRPAIFAIFLISGFLHELALSFPAGAGWGGPMLYFALQGGLVLAERKLPFRGRFWVALAVLGPLPLLFHSAFRAAIMLPFLAWTHERMADIGVERGFSVLIIALGIAHFLVLAASFQVPSRLRWREELPRLSPLNQKLMWTYGSFIVFMILSFGVLTLVLRDEILHGTKAGATLSTMIFLFWGFRLLTDALYFRSDDWPRGRFMQIGHALLNCLFMFLFLGYGAILIRTVFFPVPHRTA